jgi:hypothetical protein
LYRYISGCASGQLDKELGTSKNVVLHLTMSVPPLCIWKGTTRRAASAAVEVMGRSEGEFEGRVWALNGNFLKEVFV